MPGNNAHERHREVRGGDGGAQGGPTVDLNRSPELSETERLCHEALVSAACGLPDTGVRWGVVGELSTTHAGLARNNHLRSRAWREAV